MGTADVHDARCLIKSRSFCFSPWKISRRRGVGRCETRRVRRRPWMHPDSWSPCLTYECAQDAEFLPTWVTPTFAEPILRCLGASEGGQR